MLTTLGHCSAHNWQCYCQLHSKRMPLIFQILSQKKKSHPPPSKSWSVHAHHHMVIQDLEFSHAIFSKMDNGSILHIFFVFTAKIFFSIISNRKFWLLPNVCGWMRSWGILRRRRSLRERCWEKAIQVAYYFLPCFFHFDLIGSSLYLFTLPFFFITSLSDDSQGGNEEERRPMTKEEEDVDILHSWIEVGGQPALPEGEAQELLVEVSKFPCLLPFHLPLSIPHFLS